MAELRAAGPDDARAVWESFERSGRQPSVRSVALALNQTGHFLPVNYQAVQRWRKAGWKVSSKKSRPPALAAAANAVEAALPVLTGDAATRTDDLVGKPSAPRAIGEGEAAPSTEGRGSPALSEPISPMMARAREIRAALEAMSDDQLIKAAARQGYITATVLLKLVEENPDLLVMMPRELGSLQAALAGSLQASNNAFGTLLDLTDRLMKTVPDTGGTAPVTEADPFDDVMREIKKVEAA